MNIIEFFKENPRVAIAFSGGVDSSYLLYAASQYADDVKAYYVKSAFQPQFEYEDAMRVAEQLGVDVQVIAIDVLSDEQVRFNPWNRCYYCKRQLFGNIYAAARKDGYEILLDGTNASDDVSDRPGMRVLQEMKVLSPLRVCGLCKDEIRRLSKEAGLFTWDKPAYACLATRIQTNQPITVSLLERTENAESYMYSLGFRDFRIRTVGDVAKIQLREEQIPLLLDKREDIYRSLSGLYDSVTLDLMCR